MYKFKQVNLAIFHSIPPHTIPCAADVQEFLRNQVLKTDLCASIDEAIPLTLDVCLLEFQASNPAIHMLQILLIFAEFFLWRLQINNIILSCKSSDRCFVILEFSLLI